jgi:hypothetical protein
MCLGLLRQANKRNIAFLTTCYITPSFQDEKHVGHVLLVATVTLSGQAFTPLLLTISSISFKSEELVTLRQTVVTYRTPCGYITKERLLFEYRCRPRRYILTPHNRRPSPNDLSGNGQL